MASEDFSSNDELWKGVTMAFMLLLSTQKGLTFRVSNQLMECFPFDEYELHAERGTEETTFMLQHCGDRCQ